MKKLLIIQMLLAVALSGLAEPLQWVCEWPKSKAQQFELYQGEIATFEPTFRINGGAPTNLPVVTVWYQTNGMDRAWWHTDGAVFHPTNDVGAASYRFFVDAAGDGGKLYRANGTLRMLPSPGFVPNTIDPPIATLDFDHIAVSNAPWPTAADIEAATNDLSQVLQGDLRVATNNLAEVLRGEIAAAEPGDYATVSNKAMTALQSYTETDPTISSWAKASSKPTYYWSEILQRPATWDWSAISSKPTTLSGYGITDAISRSANTMTAAGVYTEYLINPSLQGGVRIRYSSTSDANQTTYMYSGVAARRNGATTDYLWDTSSESGVVRRSELSSKADASVVTTLANKVDAIETWAIGDETALVIHDAGQTNATLTVTYTNDVMYSSAVAESNTLAKARAQTDSAIVTALEVVGTALDAKAPKAWGTLTSGGAPAPDDTLVIEKKKVAITGGGNYASIESSTGCYYVLAVSLGSEWTLESIADAQNPTNAATVTFRDSDGNGVYQIVSTASRPAYAIAGADMLAPAVASVGGNDVVTMNFPVVAAEPPTMYYTPNLTNEFAEASSSNWPGVISSVVWSGSSGLYTATVTMVGQPGSGFFCAKYIKPGSTYVRYLKPICVPSITIDDITYTISVETINGKKLMVLTEVN